MVQQQTRTFFNGWTFKDILMLAGLIGTMYVGLYRVQALEANQERIVTVTDAIADRQTDMRIRLQDHDTHFVSVERRLDLLEAKLNR